MKNKRAVNTTRSRKRLLPWGGFLGLCLLACCGPSAVFGGEASVSYNTDAGGESGISGDIRYALRYVTNENGVTIQAIGGGGNTVITVNSATGPWANYSLFRLTDENTILGYYKELATNANWNFGDTSSSSRDYFFILNSELTTFTRNTASADYSGLFSFEPTLAWDSALGRTERPSTASRYNTILFTGSSGYVFENGYARDSATVLNVNVTNNDGIYPSPAIKQDIQFAGVGGAIGTTGVWWESYVQDNVTYYTERMAGGMSYEFTVPKVEFNDNYAESYGGAIFTHFHLMRSSNAAMYGNVTISTSAAGVERIVFSGNKAGIGGGAIYATAGSIDIGDGALFDSNAAGYSTGFSPNVAIYAKDTTGVYGHYVQATAFGDLYYVRGGAIALNARHYANPNTPGVVATGSLLIGENATFKNNTVLGPMMSLAVGGAIFAEGATVEIGANAEFLQNLAGDVTSTSASNSRGGAGGAIYNTTVTKSAGGDLILNNNTKFVQNKAASRGGAIVGSRITVNDLVNADDMDKTGVGFYQNTTQGTGGAIYGSTTTFYGNVKFLDNHAYGYVSDEGDGGAVYATVPFFYKSLNITGEKTVVTFQDNTAFRSGGGLHDFHNAYGDEVFPDTTTVIFNVDEVYFLRNIAGWNSDSDTYNTVYGFGGAVFSARGAISFDGTGKVELVQNKARSGGAVFAQWGNITFGHNALAFENSTVGPYGTDGGALWASHAVLAGTHFHLEGNQANKYGGGVFISVSTGAITLGDYTSLLGNIALAVGASTAEPITGGGGALYAGGHISLGARALAMGNETRAGSGVATHGGAIWAGNGLDLGGSTYFSGNRAWGFGGAVFLRGGSAASKALSAFSTAEGDIAFSGNLDSVASVSRANSLYFWAHNVLTLSGPGHVYFDDPIDSATTGVGGGGNRLVVDMEGGFVRFLGASTLNADGLALTTPGVLVQKGAFRLESNASFNLSGANTLFSVEEDGSLLGSGSVMATTIDIKGTIAPDLYSYSYTVTDGGTETYTDALGNTITRYTSGRSVSTNDYTSLGDMTELKLSGTVNFIAAKLEFDLSDTVNAIETGYMASDRIVITGAANFQASNGDKNTVQVSDFYEGNSYILVIADTMTAGQQANFGSIVDATGNTFESERGGPSLNILDTTQTSDGKWWLVLNYGGVDQNLYMNWTNAQSTGVWDGMTQNWTGKFNTNEHYFASGDYAIFSSAAAGTVTVASGGVAVSGIKVESGEHTFAGGAITERAPAGSEVVADAAYPLYTLSIAATGQATVANSVTLSGGVQVLAGGGLVLADGGALNAMAVASAGAVTVDRATAYTWNSVVTGTGTFEVKNTGALTVTAAGQVSTFTHSGAGTVDMNAAWTGNLIQKTGSGIFNLAASQTWTGNVAQETGSGAFAAGNAATVTGTATFLSKVDPGTRLNITGNTVFNGATLEMTLDNATPANSDRIVVAGPSTATFQTANGKSTVSLTLAGNLDDYAGGKKYILVSTAAAANLLGVSALVSGAQVPVEFMPLLFNNQTKSRGDITLQKEGADLVLTINDFGENVEMVWAGNTNAIWNTTDANWTAVAPYTYTKFEGGDTAIFDTTAPEDRRTVTLAGDMYVSEMQVNGGDYVFSGESILSTDQIVGTVLTKPVSQKLIVSAGSATFGDMTIGFAGGAEVASGAKLGLTDGIAFASPLNVANNGDVEVNFANAASSLDWTGNLSGTGTLTMAGQGNLNFVAGTTLAGTLKHTGEGTINLASNWTGGAEQSAGAGRFTAENGVTVTGNASFAGEVESKGIFTVGGNLDLTGGTVVLTLDNTSPAANQIQAGGRILSDGTTMFDLALTSFEETTYTILTSAQNLGIDEAIRNDANLRLSGVSSRFSGNLKFADDTRQVLQLVTSFGGNIILTWTGAESAVWNWATTLTPADHNWIDETGTITEFAPGDTVIFDGVTDNANRSHRTITLSPSAANEIVVSDMYVTGSADYVFQGGAALVGSTDPRPGLPATGSLVKTGTGTLTFNQAAGSRFAGTVDIREGTLALGPTPGLTTAASLEAGSFVLASGATLSVGGNVTNGSTETTLSTATIHVAGDADIQGTLTPNLTVDAINQLWSSTVLTTNVIGVDGTLSFASASDAAKVKGENAIYSYVFEQKDDSTVQLRLNQKPKAFGLDDDGLSDNTTNFRDAIVDYLDAGGTLPSGELGQLVTRIYQDPDLAAKLMTEANAAVVASGVLIPQDVRRHLHSWVRSIIREPLEEEYEDEFVADYAYANLYTPPVTEWRVYGEGVGVLGTYGGWSSDPGWDYKSYGVVVGADRMFGEQLRVGGAAYFAHSKYEWDQGKTKTEADHYSGTLFVRYDSYTGWFATAQVDYGRSDADIHRDLPLMELRTKTDYDLTWGGGVVAVGWRGKIGDWHVSPSLGLNYMRINNPSFRESGAGELDWQVSSDHYNSLQAQFGVDLAYCMESVTARLSAGAFYEIMDKQYRVNTTLYNTSIPTFHSYSPDLGRLGGYVGAGMDYRLAEQFSLYMDYQGLFQKSYQMHTGLFGVKYAF